MLYRPDIDDLLCFVLMPFGGYFDDYYRHVIRQAIEDAGLQPLRADEIYGSSSVIQQIWNYIWKASIVVADVTGRNPNVSYELGLCHALNIPVVIITQNIDDVPFDFRHIRCIRYDTRRTGWEESLRKDLKGTISAMLRSEHQAVVLPWPDKAALGIDGGVDIRNTRYGFAKALREVSSHVILTGSNFGDVLGTRENRKSDLFDAIVQLLQDNNRAVVEIVFAPPRLLKSETKFGYKDLVEMSLPRMWDLAHDPRLSDDQRSRLRIKTHRGAFFLAAFVRDPDDPKQALIVITPRWVSDATGRARMFVALWQRECPDEFRAIWGEMEANLRLESEGTLTDVIEYLSRPEELGHEYREFIYGGRPDWRLPATKTQEP